MTTSGDETELSLEESDRPDPPEPRLEAGVRIADKYEVRAPLGTGAFAVVYDARDLAKSRQVAIKVLHVVAHTPHGLVERFRREARVSAKMRHPNVLEVFDTGTLPDGSPYLVMERLSGETLAARIARMPLSLAQTVEVGCQLLDAVEAVAEAGIVHRDIKPDNVMLHEPEPDAPTVKLVDFGISKRVSAIEPELRLTSHGALVGTPQYMSPEQIRGEEVDVRTDIYAVGAVLYEALTGKAPHECNNFSELVVAVLGAPVPAIRDARPEVPMVLEHVILRALARTPHDRYGTPRAFREALEQVANALGLARGVDAFKPGNLDIGGLVVLNDTTRGAIIGRSKPAPSPVSRRRPLSVGIMLAAVFGAPAFALHVYGEPWFEPAERVHAQRTQSPPPVAQQAVTMSVARTPPSAPPPVAAAQPTSEPASEKDAAHARDDEAAPPKSPALARTAKQAGVASAPQKPGAVEPAPKPEAEQPRAPADAGSASTPSSADARPAPAQPSADALSKDTQVADAQVATAAHTEVGGAAVASDAGATAAPATDAPSEVAHPAAASEEALDSGPPAFVEVEPSAREAAVPRRTHKQIMEAALAALVRGRLVEAATRYNEAVRLDPKEPSGFRGLGLVAARLGNHAGARWALSRYLVLAPKAPDAAAIAARIAALPR